VVGSGTRVRFCLLGEMQIIFPYSLPPMIFLSFSDSIYLNTVAIYAHGLGAYNSDESFVKDAAFTLLGLERIMGV